MTGFFAEARPTACFRLSTAGVWHILHNATSSRAFTLVEVLVVVSIITILIALLLPALRSARDAARAAQCLASQRQIGMGVHAYLGDNRELMPAGDWTNWPSAPGDDARWYTLINRYVGGIGHTRDTAGIGTANPTLSKVLLCAGAPIPRGFLHFSSNPIVLGRKSEFVLSPGIPHLSLKDIRRPAKIVIALDATQNVNSGNVQSVAFMMDSGSPFWGRFATGGLSATQRNRVIPLDPNVDGPGTPPLGHVRWRHFDNATLNAIFFDGHAQSHKQGSLTEDNFFPQGWRAKF